MTWREELLALRHQGFDVLDWLSARDDGEVTIVACLVRSDDPSQIRLVHSPAPVVSVADLFPSAAWHERETAEMFGADFGGLTPPLLRPAGSPPVLRKQTPLPARLHEWPGAVDPAKPLRRQDPPGTPWT